MANNGFSLADRIALVTGGGRGLGLEIARALHAAGAHVTIADLDRDNGERAASEVKGNFIQTDVADPASVHAMMATLLQRHERIDVFVNNAGVCHNTPSEDVSDDEWRRILSVNLDGVFWCCREAGRQMLKQGHGSIINIASMSGRVSNHPQPQAAYNSSKAAVAMLTKSLAGEWAARGVRVNSISPGYIGTEMTQQGMSNREWRDTWLSSTPMGRVAEPTEIAPAVVYLASPASSFTTGTDLVIDGGYTVW